MNIVMRELAGGETDVLAGAPYGRRVLAQLVEKTTTEPDQPEPVFLDFVGINVATASFLRETVFGFRNAVRHRRSNFYPVVANASELVAGELKVLVEQQSDVLMLCSIDSQGKPKDARLLGDLDPKQRITFDLVHKRGETDASELMREHGKSEEKEMGRTAWNNRLAALAGLGLVVELSQGRAKRYRPLLTES